MKQCEIKRYNQDGELRFYEDGTQVKCYRGVEDTLTSVRVKMEDGKVYLFDKVKDYVLYDLIQKIKDGDCEMNRCQPVEFVDNYQF